MTQENNLKKQGWVSKYSYFLGGGALTVVYLGVIGAYLYAREVDICRAFSEDINPATTEQILPSIQLNLVGDFLAGVFAPLAFLWFVVSMLQTSRALRLQQEELNLSVAEMKAGNQTAKENADHIKKDVFLAEKDFLLKMIEADLVALCMAYNLEGKKKWSEMNDEKLRELGREAHARQRATGIIEDYRDIITISDNVFLMAYQLSNVVESSKEFFQDQWLRKYQQNYVRNSNLLLDRAKVIDENIYLSLKCSPVIGLARIFHNIDPLNHPS